MDLLPVLFVLGFVFFILFWVTVGGTAFARFRRKRLRRLSMQQAVEDLNWAFSDRHPMDGVAFGFRMRGDGSGTGNFISGARDGLPVTVFDAWTYRNLSEGRTPLRKYTWYTCAVLQIPTEWPHLTISKETRTSRLLDRTGTFSDIDFESEGFNRLFEVNVAAPLSMNVNVGLGLGALKAFKAGISSNLEEARRWQRDGKRFAHALIDAQMMEWLMQAGGRFGFEVLGAYLLCYAEQPTEARELVDKVFAFRRRIPRVVFELFPAQGTVPAQADSQLGPAPQAAVVGSMQATSPVAAEPAGVFPADDPRNTIRPDELPLRADDPRIPALAKVLTPEQLKLLLG